MNQRNFRSGFLFVCISALLWSCGDRATKPEEVNIRLQWIPQAQFAGYIVALQKGYYTDEGLKVTLLPAGPDIKPHLTVASGSDHFGVGVPNQIISARANGVPLKVVGQFFQDSPNRYVLKGEHRIDSLQQLRGEKVGLWLGGDEAEFISMLATAGMRLEDVKVVPQGYTIAPFLNGEYRMAMVTTYSELNLLRTEGAGELQVLSPEDYRSAILGDMLFTTDSYLRDHPETVRKVLRATIKGWRYSMEYPEETLDIVLKYNSELERAPQAKMLRAVNELITSDPASTKGIGYLDPADYATAERILRASGQLTGTVDVTTCYDMRAWEAVEDSIKFLMP